MSEMDMTPDRVLELIEIYGAEAGAWPEDEREAARALIAASPEIYEPALAEARALDALLEAETIETAPAGLAERILAEAPKPKRTLVESLTGWIVPKGVRWPAGATLASLAVGLVGGYAYAATGSEPIDTVDGADAIYESVFGEDVSSSWFEESDFE